MTAASILDELRPGLGQLARALVTGDDRDVVTAAKALDLGKLAAVLDPEAPIIVSARTSRRRKAREPMSPRMRLAGRLARLDINPRVDLDRWSHDFITSAVATLRADLPLSDRQAAVVERLLKMKRRRFHER